MAVNLKTVLVSAIVAITLTLARNAPDDNEWIDPGDMLNFKGHHHHHHHYDQDAQKQKEDPLVVDRGSASPSGESASSKVSEKCDEIRKELQICQSISDRERQDFSNEKNTLIQQCPLATVDGPFLKQYINVLLRHFASLRLSNITRSFIMLLGLEENDVIMLKRYVVGKATIQDAHGVLTAMVKSVRELEPGDFPEPTWLPEWLDLDALQKVITIMLMVIVGMYIQTRLHFTLTQFFVKVVILFFVASIPWTWWRLYKMEHAKRLSQLDKSAHNICRQADGAWNSVGRWFKSVFTFESNDECTKYYEAIMVDPIWDVPPTKALVVTVTKFVLEPAEHIGEAIKKFLRSLFQDLPVTLWPLVFIMIIVVTIILFITCCNYRISIFGIPIISPDNSHRQNDENRKLKNKNRELKQQLREAQQQNALLPPQHTDNILAGGDARNISLQSSMETKAKNILVVDWPQNVGSRASRETGRDGRDEPRTEASFVKELSTQREPLEERVEGSMADWQLIDRSTSLSKQSSHYDVAEDQIDRGGVNNIETLQCDNCTDNL